MALPITCPKCKAQNPAGAMFCSAWWAASSAGARGTERLSFLRRTVSAREQDFAPLAAPQSSQPLRLIRRSLSSR